MRRGRSGDPHRGRARPLRGHARRTGSGSAGCRGGGRAPRPGRRGAFRLHGNHLGKRGRLCDAHPVRVDHRGAGRGGSPGHVLRGALRRYQRRGPRSAISFTRSADEPSSQTLLSIRPSADSASLTCDALALSKSYLLAEGASAGIELSAHSSELNELLGADDSEIASAIAPRASIASPTATLATWDGEVYIDCNEDVLTTTFHLDDAASTIVQLSLDRATGELSAL